MPMSGNLFKPAIKSYGYSWGERFLLFPERFIRLAMEEGYKRKMKPTRSLLLDSQKITVHFLEMTVHLPRFDCLFCKR